MNKTRFVFSIAVVALLVATPAMGQLNNFPILALPAGDADGATSIGAGWGRGLNESTGKLNSFVIGAARAMESVSFGVSGGYVVDVLPDVSEITFGGSVAYNAPQNDLPVRFGIQGGIEWMSVDNVPDNTTLWNFPIGISIQGSTQAGSMTVRPWIMPRWQWTRSSGGGTVSSTENNGGISTGISGVMESGFGIGLSLDWTRPGQLSGAEVENIWLFGAAVFYRLP